MDMINGSADFLHAQRIDTTTIKNENQNKQELKKPASNLKAFFKLYAQIHKSYRARRRSV